MTDPNPLSTPGGRQNLIDRAKNIILTPRSEWAVIEREPSTIRDLYVGYACILAAIPPLAQFIGGIAFRAWAWGIGGIISGVVSAIVTYVLSLAFVALIAIVVEALAPQFGRRITRIDAFKLIIYSSTPAWLAGVFLIWWPLSPLTLLGLYGFWLVYLGWQQLAKVSIVPPSA